MCPRVGGGGGSGDTRLGLLELARKIPAGGSWESYDDEDSEGEGDREGRRGEA